MNSNSSNPKNSRPGGKNDKISDPKRNSLDEGVLGELASCPVEDKFVELLECPICKEISLPPIYNCDKGHVICKPCRRNLPFCPLCKSNYSNSRNYALESVILHCMFHCPFKEKGCAKTIKGEVFLNHVSKCRFNPVNKKKGEDISEDFSGAFKWIVCSDESRISTKAVSAGYYNDFEIVVARAKCNDGSIVPGRLNLGGNEVTLYLNHEEKEKVFHDFELLLGAKDAFTWEKFNKSLPSNPLIGGRTEIGQILYIGRIMHQESMCIGHILPGAKKCFYTFDGKPHYASSDFDILCKTEVGLALELSSLAI